MYIYEHLVYTYADPVAKRHGALSIPFDLHRNHTLYLYILLYVYRLYYRALFLMRLFILYMHFAEHMLLLMLTQSSHS